MSSSSKSTSADCKLMDRLVPDESHGRLVGLLGTTYELQPEFFETDFLPTLFGLGAWDDRSWSSRIALEKKLSELEAATLLMDAHPYRARPRSLRIEVQPVCMPGGASLHAKVLVGVYEKAIRVILGSANLTEPGYRRNREVVAVLTASEDRPGEVRLVREVIEQFRDRLQPWQSASVSRVYELADELLADWPIASALRQEWFVWSGGGETPLWQQFLSHWPDGEPAGQITIVSPFWSAEHTLGPLAAFLSELRRRNSLADAAELRLLTCAEPETADTFLPKLPESFASFDSASLGVAATALAVDPRVTSEEIDPGLGFLGQRSLHAKVVLVEGPETSLAYFGSANFTRRGWGFMSAPNLEAGLILRRTGADRTGLQGLIPRTTGAPVSLNGSAHGRIAAAEPNPEASAWPRFVQDVRLVPSSSDLSRLELVIQVDTDTEIGGWCITHTDDEAPDTPLFEKTLDRPVEREVRISLTPQQLERILREQEVCVRWSECETGRNVPVNVALDARAELPLCPGAITPAELHLIAYYQGQVAWEDLYPEPAQPEEEDETKATDTDELFGVDTSRIQSYLIREFVEALSGIRDDLARAALAPPQCMRLALLGQVSPVTLARHVLKAVQDGERTPTAAGFQLVEILACLESARHTEVTDKYQDNWAALVTDATGRVQEVLTQLTRQYADDLPESFGVYVETIRNHWRLQEIAK
ncbi:hypothetical protein Mal4_56300 [Maioricimonas rarisocia]|uniref:PLD phosphodiesterase domain-containing protein n=1 Tax=Maioricimonas rarisocia TaxID=2528026 RepID=A0A517ZFN3_9PLAN|nr:hypothetical protein [Maioricimonas rarisocia]QDU41264.1 hypothetical protein Mal4_56300 [Maioricimonas rarisocia]